ncbi:MAG: helix-turn-helix domain-containing protein [Acidimicrobiales bacterium]
MVDSHSAEAQGSVSVSDIASLLLGRVDELADEMTAAIQNALEPYQQGLVDHETLRAASMMNIGAILEDLGRVNATVSLESRENGRSRAAAGVPLTIVLEAYRVGARFIWEHVASTARKVGASSDVVLAAGSELWQVLDTYSQELAEGYREEASARAMSDEQQRSALFQALFEGHLAVTNPWEAGQLLRLPQGRPLVVVAAEVPAVGSHALPRIEHILRVDVGLSSAWRLLPDIEVGVVCLPSPSAQLDELAGALSTCAVGRVGVSPPFSDLRETPSALTLARMALASSPAGNGVTIFDRQLLAVAAVSSPDLMERLAKVALAGLDSISIKERVTLLETFGVWLDCGGSAQKASEQLFVHRNTVHQRLRKLEMYTGHDLSDPRSSALITLAFEIDRRASSAPVRIGPTMGSSR